MAEHCVWESEFESWSRFGVLRSQVQDGFARAGEIRMPVEVAIWRLSEKAEPISFSGMDNEKKLEDILAGDIRIADPGWFIIGRQVATAFGKYVDLLAIDAEGQLVVLELKRERTPREAVAQLLDYGSWVRGLDYEEIASIFRSFQERYRPAHRGRSLEEAFVDRFAVEQLPEALNQSHKLVLVASELDHSSERIITYLAEEYGVSINAVFFRVFRDNGTDYLSRAWLADPEQVEERVEAKREKRPWNGEYYVSFGADHNRVWEEARKYGFISAGGGSWYTRSLSLLEPGGRIWVNIPRVGYVGVGIVKEPAVPIDEFKVDTGEGRRVPIMSLRLNAAEHTALADDPEKAEHMVRVQWLKTVPEPEAVREKGFFGNQNSAAKPRAESWRFTVERLKQHFGIANDE